VLFISTKRGGLSEEPIDILAKVIPLGFQDAVGQNFG